MRFLVCNYLKCDFYDLMSLSIKIILIFVFLACQSRVAAEEMMKTCHSKKTCTVEAEEYIFGNPCPMGVNKYLNVIYTCGEL